MAVHLFVLYCGMLSYITIPVALAVYPAAMIAGAQPMKVGYRAIQLGFGLFILPFFFVTDPNLVLQGNIWECLLSFNRALLGLFILASTFEEYMLGIGLLIFRGLSGYLTNQFIIINIVRIRAGV